jgi:mannosyltransferase OCH1-like enzyme
MSFPRVIHQIWLGPNPFPAQAEAWRRSFAKFLPEWDYRLWTDADLPALEPEMICPELVMDEKIGMGIRPDVLRYELLRLHGGLYLDFDMELLRPLDEIMIEDCVHFGFELPDRSMIGTAIIASPQGHPFWDLMLHRIKATVKPERPANHVDVIPLTGPVALREGIYAWTANNMNGAEIKDGTDHTVGWLYDHADMVGWSSETVYPYYVSERDKIRFKAENYPHAFAAHHWGLSWVAEDAEYKAGQ